MNFGQAIKTVFSKYAVFEGRASRPEFWWWILFTTIVYAATGIIALLSLGPVLSVAASYDMLGYMMLNSIGAWFLYNLAALAFFIPTLAVLIRRLRDTGRPAWYLLLLLVPVAGYISLLVMMMQPAKDSAK